MCKRVIIINRGHIIADDTPENLSKGISNDHSINLRIKGKEGELQKLLSSIPSVKTVVSLGVKEEGTCDFNVEPRTGYDIREALSKKLSESGKVILKMSSNEMNLEQIFLRLTEMSDKGQNLFVKNTKEEEEDSDESNI